MVTDQVRDGRPVVGFGFNSNGRYGQGSLMRERLVPLATGENLVSHLDALNLARYGGLDPQRDYLQFDCALSYGLVEYLRTLEALAPLGWEPRRFIPHGGHQMSLNIAAGLGLGGDESYPDLFQPFGGFPDGVTVDEGYITMPELPGIGCEGKADLAQVCAELAG
ncbi:enolase C-terminal domain-like protein [Serinicoccus marinus]|uniref:enolase C-terminal domain-like protein n=1 Tax=Serinicoccus marinus TaxID=247333 RepID=UPI0003B5DC60|nr:enolase C-terminal domain-like protein [Serinicoccus marinus]